MKKFLRILLSGVFAGVLIGLAATVNLHLISGGHKVMGAFTFPIGLYTIIVLEQWLYTGKIGFILNNKPSYLLDLLACLLGNFIGICAICGLACLTRTGDTLYEVAKPMVDAKYNDSWYSLLLLSVLCGMIIYLAVVGHKKIENPVGKVVCVFFLIALFILCGFEHVIADAAYFFYAKVFDLKTIGIFAILTIGNSIGSILIDLLLKGINKLSIENQKGTKN